jgi:cytochrome c-type biogenesis protein CcmH
VIELAPARAGPAPAGATLFIVVREARLQRGPPAAVKRLDAASFPLRFELSDKDSMAGEPLPDPLRIEARLDGDGNAMTREPGDLTAVEDGVRSGNTNLRLVLRRQ